MTVTNPIAFLLLLVLLPIGVIMWRRYVTGTADLRALTGLWRKVEFSNVFVVKWFFSSLCLLMFVIFSVLALAGIYWGNEPVTTDRKGREVIFLMDVSRSMLAQDIVPSRLLRASAIAKSIIERGPESRFGIVVFKGAANLVIPITEDSASLLNFLDSIHTDLLSASGTNIELGIRTAIGSFSENIETGRTIILFTDGGFLEGNPLKAALEVSRQRIDLIVVAAGTNKASPIPLADGSFVTDENGMIVTTSLREDVIREIARVSEGSLHNINEPGIVNDLDQLLSRMGLPRMGGFSFETQNRYRLFLLISLLWLGLALVLKTVKWKNVF